MKLFRVLFLLAVFLMIVRGATALTVTGFSEPAGIAVDPTTGFIYVSNINGSPTVKDANGFISRLNRDGTMEQLRFIGGELGKGTLHAPKGLKVVGTTLYIADIDVVHVYQLPEGKPLSDISFGANQAQSLYDMAIGPDGALYVADASANTIYRIDLGTATATPFITDEGLGKPHSVVWHQGHQLFLIGGWNSGQMTAFDRTGKRQPLPAVFLRTLEGMTVDDSGNIYVTSASLRAVYRLSADMKVEGFQRDLASPGAIAYDGSLKSILVILADSNALRAFSLPSH